MAWAGTEAFASDTSFFHSTSGWGLWVGFRKQSAQCELPVKTRQCATIFTLRRTPTPPQATELTSSLAGVMSLIRDYGIFCHGPWSLANSSSGKF